MGKQVALFFCLFVCVHAQYNRGQPCDINDGQGSTGVCKTINECPFARKMLYEDEKHPPMCSWDGRTRIVCCPTDLKLIDTGPFSRYFGGVNAGVKRHGAVTCRSNGRQPISCCGNQVVVHEQAEPQGCPNLKRIHLRTNAEDSHIAWQKCLEYRRYEEKCVSQEDDMYKYTRVSTCGMNGHTNRILSGDPALDKEFPHMAVLGGHSRNEEASNEIIWMGGGSLINEWYILTAAHVLSSLEHGNIQYALLGTNNKADVRSGFLYSIIDWIIHENYEGSSQINDIALLKVDRQVQFNEFIRPACLPLPDMMLRPERIIAGWGSTSKDLSHTSNILLQALVEEDERKCIELGKGGFKYDSRKMICALGKQKKDGNRSDTCQGDSGGPLMAMSSQLNCTFVVAGVVSYGPVCGGVGVYTRVVAYIDWITKYVWPNSGSPLINRPNRRL